MGINKYWVEVTAREGELGLGMVSNAFVDGELVSVAMSLYGFNVQECD